LEVLDTAIQQEKQIKGIQIGKKDVNLLADDKILYIENPKDSTQKQLELISEFSKVTECKINTEKSVTFLYTNNEISERECKKEKTIPFKITPPTHTHKKKFLGINLTKEVKDLYAGNYKTLIKEIKDDSKKWKDISYPWIN